MLLTKTMLVTTENASPLTAESQILQILPETWPGRIWHLETDTHIATGFPTKQPPCQLLMTSPVEVPPATCHLTKSLKVFVISPKIILPTHFVMVVPRTCLHSYYFLTTNLRHDDE